MRIPLMCATVFAWVEPFGDTQLGAGLSSSGEFLEMCEGESFVPILGVSTLYLCSEKKKLRFKDLKYPQVLKLATLDTLYLCTAMGSTQETPQVCVGAHQLTTEQIPAL